MTNRAIETQSVYPGAELILIARFMEKYRIPPEKWLLGSGLPIQHFDKPEQLVSLQQFDVIYRNVYRLIDEPDLGLRFGKQLNITRWGLLASALLSSQKLETALFTASKYKSLLRSRFHIDTNIKDSIYYFPLSLLKHLKFPVNEQFGYEVTLSSLQQQISDMLGHSFYFEEVGFPYSKPTSHKHYLEYFKGKIHFDCDVPFYAIKKSDLKTTLPLANKANKRIALHLCESELNRIDTHWQQDIPTLTRQSFYELENSHWNLDAIAAHLNMTPRTLRRKLQEAGTNFREIKHSHAMNLACDLLHNQNFAIEIISLECGYGDVNSFREAFKHFTGKLPSKYRND